MHKAGFSAELFPYAVSQKEDEEKSSLVSHTQFEQHSDSPQTSDSFVKVETQESIYVSCHSRLPDDMTSEKNSVDTNSVRAQGSQTATRVSNLDVPGFFFFLFHIFPQHEMKTIQVYEKMIFKYGGHFCICFQGEN